jgi:hypothetical protein
MLNLTIIVVAAGGGDSGFTHIIKGISLNVRLCI